MATPRTDAAKWKSDMDCYGQFGFYVHADFAAELETELQDANNLIERLAKELGLFDCDDSGNDLKEEVSFYLKR